MHQFEWCTVLLFVCFCFRHFLWLVLTKKNIQLTSLFLLGGIYESMTIENVYRVFMKLVIRPKDHTDFGAYKCIANNTLGESEKIIHLHRKLIPTNDICVTEFVSFYLIWLVHFAISIDKSKASDTRNFVLANQVDSAEIMNSGKSFEFRFMT